MRKKFYIVYKLPIWVFVFTVVTLITLISCHNATVNPPTIEMIRKSVNQDLSYDFSLNDEYYGVIDINNDVIKMNIEKPNNISGMDIVIDDSLHLGYDEFGFDFEVDSLMYDNKIYLLKNAINSIYQNQSFDISRWNDKVTLKTKYNNENYKFVFDDNLNIKNIKFDDFDLKLD